ncbi:hypothetical protein Tco_1148341, partial [Tanacetum coccineum]
MAATTMWLWLPRQDTGDNKTTLKEYMKATSLSGNGTKRPPSGTFLALFEDLDHGTVNGELLVRRKDIIRQLHDIKTKGDAEL